MPDQTNQPITTSNPLLAARYSWIAARDTSVERAAVAKIMRWAKVPTKLRKATTFAELESMGFPCHLVLRRTNSRLGTVLSDLMLRPTRAEVYEIYNQVHDEQQVDDESPLGVVLPLRNSHWIFHDLDIPGSWGDAGFYVVIDDHCFFFEKLQSFVARFGEASEWLMHCS